MRPSTRERGSHPSMSSKAETFRSPSTSLTMVSNPHHLLTLTLPHSLTDCRRAGRWFAAGTCYMPSRPKEYKTFAMIPRSNSLSVSVSSLSRRWVVSSLAYLSPNGTSPRMGLTALSRRYLMTTTNFPTYRLNDSTTLSTYLGSCRIRLSRPPAMARCRMESTSLTALLIVASFPGLPLLSLAAMNTGCAGLATPKPTTLGSPYAFLQMLWMR